MDYGEFRAKIRQQGLPHVILLAGEETYYREKARDFVLKQLLNESTTKNDIQKLSGDITPDSLLGYIEAAPFFTDKNIIEVRDFSLFQEKKKESDEGGESKLLQRFFTTIAAMPEYSYVIFVSENKPDKRKKMYKLIAKAGIVMEAEAIRAWNIDGWLRDKLLEIDKEFTRDAAAYFHEAVSMMQKISLTYLDGEFEKLALYTDKKLIAKKDLELIFASVPEVSAFALLEAISQQNVSLALKLLEGQYAAGAYAPLILSLLVRHVRQLWQAKALQEDGLRGRQLAAALELNPFIAEKVAASSRKFSGEVLKQGILDLAEADYRLKTGGGGRELLENIIINLCEKRQ